VSWQSATLSHVYFPTTAIVSLLYVLANGASAEIAVVGHEGIVGVSTFMGGKSTPSRAVVQSAGKSFRFKAEMLENEFNQAGPVLHLLLRYTQSPDHPNVANCRLQKLPPTEVAADIDLRHVGLNQVVTSHPIWIIVLMQSCGR
jgi:hypothetical protein